MATHHRPRSRADFEIAVICALSVEFNAVEALFDAYWEDKDHTYGKAPGDPNAYTTGRIGIHNVVLAFMPGMGKGAAAAVAASFRSSFPGIKLGLVVGICGGVPGVGDDEEEIILGDVVVSTGIVQYDFGRQFSDKVVRKNTPQDNLGQPEREVRAFLAKLSGLQGRKRLREDASAYLTALCAQQGFERSQYPGAVEDLLFRSDYRHKHQDPKSCPICAKCMNKDDEVCDDALESTCDELGCSTKEIVVRSRLASSSPSASPSVHFGLVASGDLVMKSGYHRDQIARKEQVVAFEMEGAGVWNNFPTIVIKGVCDYADSHKNKKWQRYAAASAATYMKAVLGEWRVADKSATSTEPEPAASKKINMVPRIHVPHFFGRKKLLQDIDALISAGPANDDQPLVLVLQALGGQGKTQLALQICGRSKKLCRGVFWIDVSSRTTAERGFGQIAAKLNGSGRPFDDVAANVRFVNESLGSWEERWLLVLDNYDEPHIFKTITDFMPMSSNGAIIVTSRHEGAARLGKLIPLPSMTQDGGKDLLLYQYRGDAETTRENAEVIKILERLGGLALAIDQAAAYINYRKITLSTFLSEYEKRKETILQHTHEQWEYHSDKGPAGLSAFTTWEMSFHQIESENLERKRHITDFLGVSAYLDPTHISEDIFRIYQSVADEPFSWLAIFMHDESVVTNKVMEPVSKTESKKRRRSPARLQWSHDCYWDVISKLYRLSLLQKISAGTSETLAVFSIHPVIRDWLQIREQDMGRSADNLQQSMKLLAAIVHDPEKPFPEASKKQFPLAMKRQLLAHIDSCISAYRSSKLWRWQSDYPLRQEIIRISMYYSKQGRYTDSQSLLEDLLAEDAKEFPDDHLDRLEAMITLAWILEEKGDLLRSEVLASTTVEERKRILGEYHPETLNSMDILATIYYDQDRLEKAKQLHLQVLESRKRVLGADHVKTLASINNLAIVYNASRRSKDAESLLLEALEKLERTLGTDHPDTLVTMTNLAAAYYHQERWKEAESLGFKVLEKQKRIVGDHHPETLASMVNLAHAIFDSGRKNAGLELLEEAERLRSISLGADHRVTVKTRQTLDDMKRAMGNSKPRRVFAIESPPRPGLMSRAFLMAKKSFNPSRVSK